jgi:predicted Zn finger-like uncharacterized protein
MAILTVDCPACDTTFPVDPAKVPAGGVRARCSVCGGVFRVEDPREREPASPPLATADRMGDAAFPGGGLDSESGPEPWSGVGPEGLETATQEPPVAPAAPVASDRDVGQVAEVEETAAETPRHEPAFGALPELDEEETDEGAARGGVERGVDEWGWPDRSVDVAPGGEPDVDIAGDEGDDWYDETPGPDVARLEPSTLEETWDAGLDIGDVDEIVDADVVESGPADVVETEPVDVVETEPVDVVETEPVHEEPVEPGADPFTLDDLQAEPGAVRGDPVSRDVDALFQAGPATAGPASEAPALPTEEPPPLPRGFQFGRRDPHEKARRLARVLVSDIITYNPERYLRALENDSLKQDFEEEIRKSWDEYVEQVGSELARETEYWTTALNDLLARGRDVF